MEEEIKDQKCQYIIGRKQQGQDLNPGHCPDLLSIHYALLIILDIVCAKSLQSCLTVRPHVAPQAPLSLEFSRQEYWSGLLHPSPGDLPNPGLKLLSLKSPALASVFFTTSVTREAPVSYTCSEYWKCIISCLQELIVQLSRKNQKNMSQLTFLINCIYLFILALLVACRIFVPQPGTKSMSPTVEAWSLSHWTAGKSQANLLLVDFVSC